MQPDQALFLFQTTLAGFQGETKATRNVIAAIPEDKKEYRPHEKNMTAAELAWHVIATEVWFLNGIADLDFPMTDSPKAEGQSIAQMLAWYDENLPKAIARVQNLTGEHLAKPISFFGVFNHPAVMYLNFANVHTIHHRGQLSAYLRPMGGRVPSIYGGSADEPFEMSAAK